MFAGTLGRSQFFVRSCLVGIAEAVLLIICVAVQYEAFFGPPGEGRHRLAAITFLISAFFGFKRIGFAIRRNRDAGGGDILPGLYAIGICTALVLQTQALIVRTNDSPFNNTQYAGILAFILIGMWLYLLFAASAPGAATANSTFSSGFGRGSEGDTTAAPSHLSLAMEQAIAGTKPIPAAPMPSQPQGFLGSVRRPPPPPQRTQFGRRGVK
jgi:uncharacterized membrane protein YhaH (DUF805 family)